MTKFFVVLVAILASVFAKQQKLSVVAKQSTTHDYSLRAELTSLAQASALQAKTAVQNQQTASLKASIDAQSGYAHAAAEAAFVTEVALVAKQIILQNLQESIDDAQRLLRTKVALYQQSLKAANEAQKTVEHSQRELTAASAVFAGVQQSMIQNERASAAANQAAAAQHQMIQDAQERLAALHLKLNDVLSGWEDTRQSAEKAAAAAASARLVVENTARNQSGGDGSGYHH